MSKIKEIVKPEKQLREDLLRRQDEYRDAGWTFYHQLGSGWGAASGEDRTEGFGKLENLLDHLDGLRAAERAYAPTQELFGAPKNSEHKKQKRIVATGGARPDDAKPEVAVASEKIASVDGEIVTLDVSRITASPLPPQARRRSHYAPAALEELAHSIKKNGLFSPIVVRPAANQYEIVFGERRWTATRIAGLKTIRAFVKVLTDAETLEIQAQENLQRENLDPLDEAFYYKFLLDNSNLSAEDLAVKFGKSERFIHGRLKLNDLIPEAVEDVAVGVLPLGHAAVIAKYAPATQKEILENWAYIEDGIAKAAVSLADLKAHIADEIVLRLTSARFDTESPDLHIKHLKCSDCRQRSGYEPLLFAEDFDQDDRCLDKSCFESKTRIYQQLEREKAAQNLPNPGNAPAEVLARQIPVVVKRGHQFAVPTFQGIKPEVVENVLERAECEFSEPVVNAYKNQAAFTCQNDACVVHFASPAPSAADLKRLRDKFEAQIAEAVSKKIFAEAVAAFNDHHPFWMFDDLVAGLITTLWDSLEGNFEEKQFICDLLRKWKNVPKSGVFSRAEFARFVGELTKLQQTQILFIFTQRGKRKTASEMEQLCKSYTRLDYRRLDAQVRYELAPDEFKSAAEDYLGHIEAGINIEIPQFWTAEPENG